MDVQAFLITFREMLEAFLVVGIITSYLRRAQAGQYTKWVWAGVGAGFAGSLVAAFLIQVVLVSFRFLNAEIWLKVGIMFVASALLAYMVLWMAKQARGAKSELEGMLDRYVRAGNLLGMVGLAFFAVLREGVETVFFFAAFTQGDITRAFEGWGAISGLIAALLLCWLFFRGAVRIPLQRFFQLSGFLLLMIAAGLFSQGISILQDLNYLGSLHPRVYDITWFMPEHPVDEEHLVRIGLTPVISSQVGVFLRALFGYAASPSIEEVIGYFGFYLVVFALVRWSDGRARSRAAHTPPGPPVHGGPGARIA